MTDRDSILRVLVVDDDADVLAATSRVLRPQYEVAEAGCIADAWRVILQQPPDIVLLDVVLPDGDGRALCRRIKNTQETCDCIVLLLSGQRIDPGDIVEGLVGGADGYLRRPVDNRELLAQVQVRARLLRAERELRSLNEHMESRVAQATSRLAKTNAELQRRIAQAHRTEARLLAAHGEISALKTQIEAENRYLRQQTDKERGFGEVVGSTRAMARVVELVEQVATTESTVLLTGETGTGKELIAHAIHGRSHRHSRAMVTVDCATLPSALVESELFGHERGAFTNAVTQHQGRFEVAQGSTVFLDEVAELPMEIQAKLLRVLEERRFERVGGTKSVAADVRLIAATNQDLEEAVIDKRFRRDLFFRLNVFPILVPPLRERLEDVPALAQHFAEIFAQRMGKRVTAIADRSIAAMKNYGWPGNVRELRNLVERSVILSRGGVLTIELPESRADSGSTRSLSDWERAHILEALEATGWRVRGEGGAADRLQIKPTTLESRMTKLGIRRPHRGKRS